MRGKAVEHEAASLATQIRRNGERYAIDQSTEEPSIVWQALACSLFARSPIDKHVGLHQFAKRELYSDRTIGSASQPRNDSLAGPNIGPCPDHFAQDGCV